MARLFSWKPALTIRGRMFRGLRGFSGKPTHPPLTDFPIVCYVLVAVFDLISFFAAEGGEVERDFFRAGTFVLVAGFLVSLPTALTGFADWLRSIPKHTQAWRTANSHMATMLTVTALVVVNLAVRLTDGDAATLPVTVLSVLAGAAVALGAALGGALVYEYGANVETAGDSPVWHESEEDVFPGEEH